MPATSLALDGKFERADLHAGVDEEGSGTSIFDPVLCELAYRWFSPPGGEILDPFSGGSVRGIVAAALGRRYLGVDLRGEQVAANEGQWASIRGKLPARDEGEISGPEWRCGDSREVIAALPADRLFDFVFSCPPYADLERYSDDPADLSAMPFGEFLAAYRAIVAASVCRLRSDRFACFVVGEVRDPGGFYRNLVGETVQAFEAAGAKFYNEAILVTACGSLPIRAGRVFEASRKLGKTHQNVLVFCKGSSKKAAAATGTIAFGSELR